MNEDDLTLAFRSQSAQIGALGRMLAITVASLHSSRAANGRAIAASIRLDDGCEGDSKQFQLAVADMINRVIDRWETGDQIGPRKAEPSGGEG